MSKGTASPRRSILSSGGLTAVSLAVLNGSAAAVGVLFAREFGRGPRTDGVFLAFNVYAVLLLAATSLRVVLLPELTRAAASGRLARAFGGHASVLGALGAAAVALSLVVAGAVEAAGGGPARTLFAQALPVVLLAGALQLLAGLCASALAALDDYRVAALGYTAAGLTGLVVFLLLRPAGPLALAWCVLANAGVALAVPLAVLAARGIAPALRLEGAARRLAAVGRGVALPVSLQALFAITAPFALGHGEGAATSFTYAFLVGSLLVAVTASSLALVSSAPLTRRAPTPEEAARHVVAVSWLALAAIAAAVGVFALVGGRVVASVLGGAYAGEVGRELGSLVVWLGPWMVVATALTVSFPLLFVVERPRVLVPLALALPVVQAPLAWGVSEWLGLRGLALSLALTTLGTLVVLMAGLSARTLALAAAGLGRMAVVLAGLAGISFGALGVVTGDVAAAAGGVGLYAVLLAVVALPLGLRRAWEYARALY